MNFSPTKDVRTETNVNLKNGVTLGNVIKLNIEAEIPLKMRVFENEIEVKIATKIVVTKKNVILEFVSLGLDSLIS